MILYVSQPQLDGSPLVHPPVKPATTEELVKLMQGWEPDVVHMIEVGYICLSGMLLTKYLIRAWNRRACGQSMLSRPCPRMSLEMWLYSETLYV
jgi:hypothetical protein